MSDSETETVYRCFCGYGCRREKWVETESEARESVEKHHSIYERHVADFEEWDAERARRWRA